MIQRRLFVFGAPFALAACTPEARDAVLAKIKEISSVILANAENWFGKMTIAESALENLRATDKQIQEATTLGEVARAAVVQLVRIIDTLIYLASLTPLPSTVVSALRMASQALSAIIGIASSHGGSGMAPTLDEALNALRAAR